MNSLSSTPQNNAGAFAAMAAGASHSAVLLSWMTRRASVATAAAAARRLLWLLDAVAAAAKLVRSVCSFVSAPFQAVAMLGKVAGAMTTSESMETVAQRSNRGRLAGKGPELAIPSVFTGASSQIWHFFWPKT